MLSGSVGVSGASPSLPLSPQPQPSRSGRFSLKLCLFLMHASVKMFVLLMKLFSSSKRRGLLSHPSFFPGDQACGAGWAAGLWAARQGPARAAHSSAGEAVCVGNRRGDLAGERGPTIYCPALSCLQEARRLDRVGLRGGCLLFCPRHCAPSPISGPDSGAAHHPWADSSTSLPCPLPPS